VSRPLLLYGLAEWQWAVIDGLFARWTLKTAPRGEARPPERVIRIDSHLGPAVLREMDQLRVPVSREGHPPQVTGHDVSEYPLVAFDCDDVLKVAAFWSAVLGRPLDRGSSELFASIGGPTLMQDPEGNEFCIAAKSFTGWD
jgi:hypothetical protein